MKAVTCAVLAALWSLAPAAQAKRVRPCVLPSPELGKLAVKSRRVFAGTVHIDGKHSTLAVDAVWKGNAAPSEDLPSLRCPSLRKAGASVILASEASMMIASGCEFGPCFRVYEDSPANRETLDKLLGAPVKP
jgi:hypothetical protein